MEKQRLRGTNTLFTEEVFVLHVTATHLVRKMSGGSHSILMMCDDGNLYVVKLAENPQGPNLLANERLGTQLAGALGLKIPVMAFVSVPSLLIDNAPKEWLKATLEADQGADCTAAAGSWALLLRTIMCSTLLVGRTSKRSLIDLISLGY